RGFAVESPPNHFVVLPGRSGARLHRAPAWRPGHRPSQTAAAAPALAEPAHSGCRTSDASAPVQTRPIRPNHLCYPPKLRPEKPRGSPGRKTNASGMANFVDPPDNPGWTLPRQAETRLRRVRVAERRLARCHTRRLPAGRRAISKAMDGAQPEGGSGA